MRKEEDKFAPSGIFEGMVSIRAVIAAREAGISDRVIERVLFDRGKADSRRGELGYLRAVSEKHGFTLEAVDGEAISALTTGSSHGGIIAVCGERAFHAPSNIKRDGFYILLDGIEDPYNFGYALRSVYAAGADGVILSPRNWMSAAGVVCRASAGASELLPIFVCDPSEALAAFRAKGYKIVCAEKKDAVSVYDADMRRPVFLIVGGEKRGISSALLAGADIRVRIDYGRSFPEALSAASAASILAFEVYRQNRAVL